MVAAAEISMAARRLWKPSVQQVPGRAALLLARIITLFLLMLPMSHTKCAADSTALPHEVYVVYMGAKCEQKHQTEVVAEHHHLLASVVGSIQTAEDAILYHYHRSFRGFAAKMSSHHAQVLSESEQVHTVFKSRHHRPATTHSWEFLGVVAPDNVTGNLYAPSFASPLNQSDVIIGFIDSGYWPESGSFQDWDMPPIPLRWKGGCVAGESFGPELCNNKVIGAKFYVAGIQELFRQNGTVLQDIISPRDIDGHGTHVASTAAGRAVANTGYRSTSIAGGTATGGASGARIAIYKACWSADVICSEADVLAAFDDAIADGVDVLSVSLGGLVDGEVFTEGISIGSFHAARSGVLVAAAAGNEGPAYATVANTAPWIFTVGASTTDRLLVSKVQLGDGSILTGSYVINTFVFSSLVPLVFGSQAVALTATPDDASYCRSLSLDPALASGAILVCPYSREAEGEVVRVGAAGVIFLGSGSGSTSFALPATVVSGDVGLLLRNYVEGTPNPSALILPTEAVLDNKPAPVVAAFSSRGPSVRNPDILKPDVIAPGVDILAAFSPLAPDRVTGAAANASYSIISGTSMACPHVAGIAALVKVAHPDWTPAAIRSAIMTTAYQVDNTLFGTIQTSPSGTVGGYFDFGAGHVQPVKALDPGLVYDILPDDYGNYLCSFDPTGLRFQSENLVCPPSIPPRFNLNYPSISLVSLVARETVARSLTNVGPLGAVTYTVAVSSPSGVLVTVDPPALQFQTVGQTLPFTIVFEVQVPSDVVAFGTLQWSDGVHFVTSPIVVKTSLV